MGHSNREIQILPLVLLLGLITGCVGGQPKVYLMPTPAVMGKGELDPFSVNPDLEQDTRVRILYATNRRPTGEEKKREYSKRPGEMLRLGFAQIDIGEESEGWDEIIELSTAAQGQAGPQLYLEQIEELLVLPIEEDDQPLPPELAVLADDINRSLAGRLDKGIMVYVHGANPSVYRAAAQAAQYHHFTGRNSLVLGFFWPTGEHILRYRRDVRQAGKSVLAFKRLISLLNEQTTAEHINILAYSAGAMIVSPALALLAKEYTGERRDKLRLGEIYYAAPDVGTDQFVEHLQAYHHPPRGVTLSINPNDSVLRHAQRHHRGLRAGRSSQDNLDEEALQWIRDASLETALDSSWWTTKPWQVWSPVRTPSGTATRGSAATCWSSSCSTPTRNSGGWLKIPMSTACATGPSHRTARSGSSVFCRMPESRSAFCHSFFALSTSGLEGNYHRTLPPSRKASISCLKAGES